jgi:molybdenum-dependent DNA-binding transcriptional regulator ModE
MAQSSVTLYAENWLREYENMQSESVMAVSELFDLKNKKARKKLNKWKQLIDKFFVQSWNDELQKP